MDTIRQRGLTGLLCAAGALCASAVWSQEAPLTPPTFAGSGQNAPALPPQGLNNFGQGYPNPGFAQGNAFAPAPAIPPLGMNPNPELGKKTAAIMALRMIVGSGLTAKEIQAVLPALRELRDAEKSFKKRTEQILDEEKTALLSAPPGGPMPPNSGDKMEDANRAFGEKSDQTWRAVMREVGPEKAGMLRQLVEGGFMPGMPGRAPGQPGFPPRAGNFGPAPGDPFFAPQTAPPGSPNGLPPSGGRGRRNQPRQLEQPANPPNAGNLPGDAAPRVSVPLEAGVSDGIVPDGPQGGGQALPPAAPNVAGVVSVPQGGADNIPPGAVFQTPRQPGVQFVPGGQGRNFVPAVPGGQNRFVTPQPMIAMGPHISISELVELLEQRLAAMPK